MFGKKSKVMLIVNMIFYSSVFPFYYLLVIMFFFMFTSLIFSSLDMLVLTFCVLEGFLIIWVLDFDMFYNSYLTIFLSIFCFIVILIYIMSSFFYGGSLVLSLNDKFFYISIFLIETILFVFTF